MSRKKKERATWRAYEGATILYRRPDSSMILKATIDCVSDLKRLALINGCWERADSIIVIDTLTEKPKYRKAKEIMDQADAKKGGKR